MVSKTIFPDRNAMFFVSDNQPDRHRAIRAFLNDRQAAIAVILSAVDFEWSVPRSTRSWSQDDQDHSREALSRIRGGNDDYKRLWKEELAGHLGITLPQAVPHWNRIVDPHRGAARLRGAILHGARGGVSVQLAQQVVDDYCWVPSVSSDWLASAGRHIRPSGPSQGACRRRIWRDCVAKPLRIDKASRSGWPRCQRRLACALMAMPALGRHDHRSSGDGICCGTLRIRASLAYETLTGGSVRYTRGQDMAIIDRVKSDSTRTSWRTSTRPKISQPRRSWSSTRPRKRSSSRRACTKDHSWPVDTRSRPKTFPLLRGLIKAPFGNQTPFTAEVWFVNRATNLAVLWGTPDPIQLQDPKFHVLVPVRAFGQYGIRITDSKRFLLKLVGTLQQFDEASISRYFRGVFTTRIKSAIATAIIANGKSVLEISTDLDTLSGMLREALAPELAEYGVGLVQFNIHSINVPEDDSAVQSLKNALSKRTEMGLLRILVPAGTQL